jgi:hypothetical protein
VQNLDGGLGAPRISAWAANAIEKGNFAAARYAATTWRLNKPYLLTLAQSLDPYDRFVPQAQALLEDMMPLEGKLPSAFEIAFSETEGAALWQNRVGRASEREATEASGAVAPADASVEPPTFRSPLRPENATSDGDGWNLLAAAAIGPVGLVWAETQRKSSDPLARVPAEIIHDLVTSSEYTRGFAIGGVSGAWAALEDNAQIAVDLYDLIKDLVTAKIAGGDLGVLRAMRDKVMEMVAAGRQVPAAIKAFADRWNDSSDLGAQGKFQGHVCGYMAVQILALVIGAVTPGGQYADVIRVLKLATDPLGGLLELGTAAKAARAAKTAGAAEHAAQGAIAGGHAAEGAIAGERAAYGMDGGFGSSWSKGSHDVRGIDAAPSRETTGGRFGTHSEDDDLTDLLTDPAPTPEVRRIQDQAQEQFPTDPEMQLGFAHKQQQILRQALLARRAIDAETIVRALQAAGVPGATHAVVDRVAVYLFDSAGIAFSYENYAAWSRLSRGTGTVDDVRFLVHEISETEILQSRGVDFTGDKIKVFTDSHKSWYTKVFSPNYASAHAEALRTEYDFLADRLNAIRSDKRPVSAEEAAAFDPTRQEGRLYMQVDGQPLKDSPDFARLQARGEERVILDEAMKGRLGLTGADVSLSELLAAVKRQPASPSVR